MRRRKEGRGSWVVPVAIIIAVAILNFGFFVGGLLVQYSAEFWLSRFSDNEVDVNYWKCSVAGVFIGWNVAIPVAFVTWLVASAA